MADSLQSTPAADGSLVEQCYSWTLDLNDRLRSTLLSFLCDTLLPTSTISSQGRFGFCDELWEGRSPGEMARADDVDHHPRFQLLVILFLSLSLGFALLKGRDVLFGEDIGTEHRFDMKHHVIDEEEEDLASFNRREGDEVAREGGSVSVARMTGPPDEPSVSVTEEGDEGYVVISNRVKR